MSIDVKSVKPGDRVVFMHPSDGRPECRKAARDAGLEVGRVYPVVKVNLGQFSCMLRLAGMGWFNSVLFEFKERGD